MQSIKSLRYKKGSNHKRNRKDSSSLVTKSKSSKKTWFGEKFSPNLVFSEEVGQFLNWLGVTLGLDCSVITKCFKCVSFLTHTELHKGKNMVINIMKEMKLITLRYLSGSPLERISIKYNRVSKFGIPTRLYDLIDLVKGNNDEIRFVLSFLTISRTIFLKPILDLSTITEEGKSFTLDKKIIKSFIHKVKLTCKSKGLNTRSFLSIPRFENYHLSSKTGPLGVNTFSGCFEELKILPKPLLESIYTLGGPVLQDHMEQLFSYMDDIKLYFPLKEEIKTSSFRRISYFSDPDGKTRVIALGDYWSQTALKPVHDKVFKVLKCIPQDQTFDQAEGLEELARLSDTTFFCYDLSAFTDRFPLDIIRSLLECWYSKEISEAISNIFVGFPFDIEGQSVNYKVGNPMGFYGSWGLTTLCHHLILFWACSNLNIDWSTAKYKLLGDDIIIWKRELAEEYKKLIAYIGVSISEQKSIIGENLFEFAKRIYYKKQQISPISFLSWKSSVTSVSGIIDLFWDMKNRGVEIHNSSVTWVLENCSYIWKVWSKRRKNLISSRLSRKIQFISSFSEFRKGHIGGATLLGELLAPNQSKFHWSSEVTCKKVILRYFAGKLVKELTSFQDELSNVCNDFLKFIPRKAISEGLESSPKNFIKLSLIVAKLSSALPHWYILHKYIHEPCIIAVEQLRDQFQTFSLEEILDVEMKLIALDWTQNPKVKTYGRAQLRRRMSLAGSGKRFYDFLAHDKKRIHDEIVNSLPLCVLPKSDDLLF